MKSLTGIMSQKSEDEYLESCPARYPGRNRRRKSAMIEEVSDTFDWRRKHTIKALNAKFTLGKKTRKRHSKKIYGQAKIAIIVEIWKRSEQPCGKRLKQTLPPWIKSYENRHGRKRFQTSHRLKTAVPVRCRPWKRVPQYRLGKVPA